MEKVGEHIDYPRNGKIGDKSIIGNIPVIVPVQETIVYSRQINDYRKYYNKQEQ